MVALSSPAGRRETGTKSVVLLPAENLLRLVEIRKTRRAHPWEDKKT
jgi:hypothetical protein